MHDAVEAGVITPTSSEDTRGGYDEGGESHDRKEEGRCAEEHITCVERVTGFEGTDRERRLRGLFAGSLVSVPPAELLYVPVGIRKAKQIKLVVLLRRTRAAEMSLKGMSISTKLMEYLQGKMPLRRLQRESHIKIMSCIKAVILWLKALKWHPKR